MDEAQRVAYQFYGCFYHGCVSCYKRDRYTVQPRLGDASLEECYKQTLAKKLS